MEKLYYIVYNDDDLMICFQEEAFELLVAGWTLHAITDDRDLADRIIMEENF